MGKKPAIKLYTFQVGSPRKRSDGLRIGTPISIGCYCVDENRCHRSKLNQLIERVARR